MALGPLNDQDGLGEIGRVDDCELRLRRCSDENQERECDDLTTHDCLLSSSNWNRERGGLVRRQLQIARQVDLHAMPLANRDGRQPV